MIERQCDVDCTGAGVARSSTESIEVEWMLEAVCCAYAAVTGTRREYGNVKLAGRPL